MFKWLFLAFVLVPCIELTLLFTVGAAMGLPATLGIILLTGFVGAHLARRQGLGAIRRIQQAMDQGRMPADELVDGMLIFAAGLLLVTPGFLTDAVGFALLIPPIRELVRRLVGAALKRSIQHKFTVVQADARWESHDATANARPQNDVIDVKAEVVDRDAE